MLCCIYTKYYLIVDLLVSWVAICNHTAIIFQTVLVNLYINYMATKPNIDIILAQSVCTIRLTNSQHSFE